MEVKSSSKVAGAAGIIMFATLLSRITGFLRTTLIYNVMMPKGYSDEFLLAFSLPDIAFNLLAGGAIAAALIPVMSSLLSKNKEAEAWKALSTFLNISMLAMLLLGTVFFIWTDGLLAIVAAGYTESGRGDRQMLVYLTRILLLNVPFMVMAGQCNGILNSYKKFAAAAFGPVAYNICTIIGILLFGGTNVYLTAWSIVGSAAIFFALQIIATRHRFVLYRPTFEFNSPAFQRMFRQAVPSLVSSSIVEFNNVVARGFATFFQEGMLTLLNNANRTWQLPMGIFAQSIGIAMLPTLSAHHAAKDYDSFRELFYKGIRIITLISLPIAALMLLANDQIMRLLFKWGSSPEADVYYGGIALMGYSASLLFASVVGVTIRAFYAMQDSITPLVGGVVGLVLNYLFNVLFHNFTDLGIAGTALAYTFTILWSMLFLLTIFSKKTGFRIFSDNMKFLAKSFAALVPAALVMGAMAYVFQPNPLSKVSQLLNLAVPAIAGLVLFYLLAFLLKIKEIAMIKNLLSAKLLLIKRKGKMGG